MLLAFDERRWAEVAGYAQSDFESLLKTYTLRRAELVKMLRQVALEDWERSGRHEVKGTNTCHCERSLPGADHR